METSIWTSFGGTTLIVTTIAGVLALLFAGAYGLYQRYKQNRYWDTCQDELEGAEVFAEFCATSDPCAEAAEKLPEPKDEVRRCCPPSPGNGPEFLEWRPDTKPKADLPHKVDNPDKLPMPTGYAMEGKMYEHARATEDMNTTKFNTELYDAIEEARKIDSGLKGLREIIREEIAKAVTPAQGVLTASGLIEDLASEYEKLPSDDLHAHGRAVVKALKAQRRAKEDAVRDIKNTAKPKAKKKPKSKAKRRIVHY